MQREADRRQTSSTLLAYTTSHKMADYVLLESYTAISFYIGATPRSKLLLPDKYHHQHQDTSSVSS